MLNMCMHLIIFLSHITHHTHPQIKKKFKITSIPRCMHNQLLRFRIHRILLISPYFNFNSIFSIFPLCISILLFMVYLLRWVIFISILLQKICIFLNFRPLHYFQIHCNFLNFTLFILHYFCFYFFFPFD